VISENVVNHRIQHQTLPLNWTDNNCETMNHIFKMEIHWKPEKLPDLVDTEVI